MRGALALALVTACQSGKEGAETGGAGEGSPALSGALELRQLDLGGFATGEAMRITGPDGAVVLLDVGNDSHADTVLDVLPSPPIIDALVLTHYHADHTGGLDALLEAGLEIRGPVLHRGDVDLGDDANRDEAEAAFSWEGLCDAGGCALPVSLDLGQGATLEIFAANATVPSGEALDPGDDENARSLAGLVRWGDFVYAWGGDLTGGGKGTADLETFVVEAGLLGPGEASVLHLNHHGISSSGSAAWMGLAAPDAIGLVGANAIYLDAPSEEQLTAFRAVSSGCVWVTTAGSLGGDDQTCEAEADVVITVRDGGASWSVRADGG